METAIVKQSMKIFIPLDYKLWIVEVYGYGLLIGVSAFNVEQQRPGNIGLDMRPFYPQ